MTLKSFLHTPASGHFTASFTALYILLQPFTEVIYYTIELDRGSYPPEADSIMIPIMEFTTGLLIVSPVILGFLMYLVCVYPGKTSLRAWNKSSPFWSIFWTLLFGLLFVGEIEFAIKSAYRVHLVDVLNSIIGAYLFLILRSSMVMAKPWNNTKKAPEFKESP